MKVSASTLVKKIVAEHAAAQQCAVDCVMHVLNCGRLLSALRADCSDKWQEKLEEVGISRTTAWRYIRVATDAAKSPKKVKYLLEQGASLVDLYRAFDLVKPVEGGGYRSEAYQRRKIGRQLELDFEYEEFDQHITTLIRARNVEELSSKTLQIALNKLDAARERVIAVLKDKEAFDLDAADLTETNPAPKDLHP